MNKPLEVALIASALALSTLTAMLGIVLHLHRAECAERLPGHPSFCARFK